MKVTNTKTEKTMYDTNGNKISVIKKESTEIDTQIFIPKNRVEGIQVRENISVYKTNLENAKKIKSNLLKIKGVKKGQQIFNSMADLIMLVDNKPVSKTVVYQVTHSGPLNSNRVIEESFKVVSDFNQGPLKKKRKK